MFGLAVLLINRLLWAGHGVFSSHSRATGHRLIGLGLAGWHWDVHWLGSDAQGALTEIAQPAAVIAIRGGRGIVDGSALRTDL